MCVSVCETKPVYIGRGGTECKAQFLPDNERYRKLLAKSSHKLNSLVDLTSRILSEELRNRSQVKKFYN